MGKSSRKDRKTQRQRSVRAVERGLPASEPPRRVERVRDGSPRRAARAESGEAEQPSLASPARPRVRRELLVIAAVVVVALLGFALWPKGRAPSAPSAAPSASEARPDPGAPASAVEPSTPPAEPGAPSTALPGEQESPPEKETEGEDPKEEEPESETP